MTNRRRGARWSRTFRTAVAISVSAGCLGVETLVPTETNAFASTATFDPVSVTFASLDNGWALGTVPCAHNGDCLALRETLNAGSTWSSRPLPAGLLAAAHGSSGPLVNGAPAGSGINVRFANALDGWIYGGFPNGGPVLWSTHNGAASWQRAPLPGLANDSPILALETARGTVYLMGMGKAQQRVDVESSPVGYDAWRLDQTPPLFLPAGGGELVGGIVLQSGAGWLVEGNDRGITGSAKLQSPGRWASWAPPCQDVGNSLTVPTASSADSVYAVCVMGGFAFPLSKSAPPGAKLGSTWLYLSTNGGRTFQHGPQLGMLGGPFFGGVLASPNPDAVVVSSSTASVNHLLATFNGGQTWSVVFRGNAFFLGFTSSAQGVGLVQSPSGSTSMIMTFDGGHHWSGVNL